MVSRNIVGNGHITSSVVGLGSMQMIGKNSELGTNQPGIDFAVDGAADTQCTGKRMYLKIFNVLLHRLPLCTATIPEHFRSRITIKISA